MEHRSQIANVTSIRGKTMLTAHGRRTLEEAGIENPDAFYKLLKIDTEMEPTAENGDAASPVAQEIKITRRVVPVENALAEVAKLRGEMSLDELLALIKKNTGRNINKPALCNALAGRSRPYVVRLALEALTGTKAREAYILE